MAGYLLSLTDDSWQVFTLDVQIDGEALHAQVEVRFLPITGKWFVSIRDHASGELLVNMVTLICSYGEKNDLLKPFRHLRDGKGIGTMLCLKGANEPATPDPTEKNLMDYLVLWSDTLE